MMILQGIKLPTIGKQGEKFGILADGNEVYYLCCIFSSVELRNQCSIKQEVVLIPYPIIIRQRDNEGWQRITTK